MKANLEVIKEEICSILKSPNEDSTYIINPKYLIFSLHHLLLSFTLRAIWNPTPELLREYEEWKAKRIHECAEFIFLRYMPFNFLLSGF